MADHNENISTDLPASEVEPRPSDAGPDAIKHTDGHDDPPGTGGYIGRVGARAGTLARAIISRSAAAGSRVRRPIGTALATLGGMLPSVARRGAGGIGLFRGTINSSNDAVEAPARANGREPSKLVWLQPVSPRTDDVGPISGPVISETVRRHPGKPRGKSSRERTKESSAGDSLSSSKKPRKKSAGTAGPIGRAAATRIRRRPDPRSLRELPTYVDSPAVMPTERAIDGRLSHPFISKSKWAPTEYESTKEPPPVTVEAILQRRVDTPKENRLRPVSFNRQADSRIENPIGRPAANHTNTNSSSEVGRTRDAPKPTSLHQVSVIHRGVAEPAVPSEKTSEVPDRRPRIIQRSKRIISRGRDAILRKHKASDSTPDGGAGQSAAVNIEPPIGTAETGSGNAKSERISRSPLSEPQSGRKDGVTGPIQSDPIAATATAREARNTNALVREQPSLSATSVVDAGNAGPAPENIGISSSNGVDVAPVQGKAKGIVNRARELVFRKPSNELRAASDSDETTLIADAVQRSPDSKPNSDLKGSAKNRTILARAREKMARKPKAARPTASTADQQAPQEAVRSAETVKKPTEATSKKSVPPVRRTLDARPTVPSSEMPQGINDVSESDSPAGEPGISSGKVDRTQSSLLSQPIMEHRADKHEPDHTAAPTEPPSMAKTADRHEPVRRSSKDTGPDENIPGSKEAVRDQRSEVLARSEGGRSLISQAAHGIKLGAQRLIFKSVPSSSAEPPALADGPSKASPPRERAQLPDAGQRETDTSHQNMSSSVLQRAKGDTSARKGIVHRRQANEALPDGVGGHTNAAKTPSSKPTAARSPSRPIGSTRSGVPSSTTGAIGRLGALRRIVSRKASKGPASSEITSMPSGSEGPETARQGNLGRSAPELLHRKMADGPAESVGQGDTLGQATLRSPLVRTSERPVIESGVIPTMPQNNGDGKSGRPTSKPRGALSHAPQVQRRVQPAAAKAPLKRATADTPTLKSKIGQSPSGFGPEATLIDSEAGRNGAAEEGLGRRLGALVHKRESHGVDREDAPHTGPARSSKASRLAEANAPIVQRASSAKGQSSSSDRAVRRAPIGGVQAPAPVAASSRASDLPAQTAAVELDETEEPLYKKFTPKDIEFLSSKMFTYIKRRLNDDRERHGRPGFSMWS
ncbi:MAG: hypothetical protein IH861_06760 [Chloroflexi bacterium]|nr:hypothetical protein [Chloroflexota bacterium]